MTPFFRKLLWAAPNGVRPQGDYGKYWVRSESEPETERLVDVESIECNCPSATVGAMAQARAAKGYVTWPELCPHLPLALAYHGIARVGAVRRVHERAVPSAGCQVSGGQGNDEGRI